MITIKKHGIEWRLRECQRCGSVEIDLIDAIEAPEARVKCTKCGEETEWFSCTENAVEAWNSSENMKVGDYVKSHYGIGKVVEVKWIKEHTEANIIVDFIEYGCKVEAKWIKEPEANIIVDYIEDGCEKDYTSRLRPATVLDYIRTLDAEQMAKLMISKCPNFCVYGCCADEYDRSMVDVCKEGVVEWLQQSLTDKILELFKGGKENE